MKYQTQLTNFTNYLLVNGLSKLYKESIRLFLEYLDKENIDLYHFDYNLFNQYLLDLKNRKLSPGYINNFIKAIRKFYEFLVNSENISATILTEVRKIKLLAVDRKITDSISEVELKHMISNAITFARRMEYNKLKAILYFMFYTGLRVSEITNLKRQDVDLVKCKAIVRTPTKNKSERYTYFPPKIGIILNKYFSIEDEVTNAFNMNYMQIYGLIKKVNTCFQNRKLSPHSLRHGFARMLVEKEIGIRVAQKLLGHKSMQSTQIYYDPDDKVVNTIYKKYVTGIVEETINDQEVENTIK